MTYNECIFYLYNQLPVFHRIGAQAYKANLDNIIALCKYLGNPQDKFKSIHVAGTNGKGSTCHILTSVLMEGGYKTGLHTSPHLIDFTERFKINGINAPESYVVNFVENHKHIIEQLQPSFFEISVAMAFNYFAQENVDYAVIEVGLGGRLDSTNIIQPEISVITNIGLDHTQFLGNTLNEIAKEKGGIIKKETPIIIGETQDEIKHVFIDISNKLNAPVYFADEYFRIEKKQANTFNIFKGDLLFLEDCHTSLLGEYQFKNIITSMQCINALIHTKKIKLIPPDIKNGLLNVEKNTGLQGRFEIINKTPLVICDTGHNKEGIALVLEQIKKTPHKNLRIVLGFVNDKNISGILDLFPVNAAYYFTQADIPRSLEAEELGKMALSNKLYGKTYKTSLDAVNEALYDSDKNDLIYIGGSNFLIAEILAAKKQKNIFAKPK